MNSITILGLVAATLTTLSFLPQAMKIIKSKNTRDISLPMYALFTSGLILWLCYGILVHDIPIIVSNTITLLLSATILILKLIYK